MLTRIDEVPIRPVRSVAAVEDFGQRIVKAESWTKDPADLHILVLLVEDNLSSARAFERELAAYGICVVLATDLSQARRQLRELGEQVDAVLLALRLPDGRGEDLLPEIEALAKQPGIVIISDSLDEVRPEVTSYRVVLAPKTIGPSVLAAILHQGATGHADGTLTRFARNYRLTSKESEVLGRVARGDSPKQTAAYLECSVQAVYVHLAGVCSKTACSSYHQVMAKLFQFSCHSLGHDERTRREAGTARLTTPLSQQDTGAAPSR